VLKTRFASWIDGVSGETVTMPPQQESRRLLAAFWVTGYVIAAYFVYLSFDLDAPLVRMLGAVPVMITAMLPAYFWCAGRVRGVPIFPLFALTYLWTYGIPFVSQHPAIVGYDGVAVLAAGLTVAGFLMLATLAWYLFAASPAPILRTERVLKEGHGRAFFFAMIVGTGLFIMGVTGQWLEIDAGVFSIVRSALFALSTVGLFALSYQWGKGELPPTQRIVFAGVFIFYLLAQLSSLFLVGAIVAAGLVIVGYTTGRRHFPSVWVLVAMMMFGFLHVGKGAMREQYWYPETQAVQIWNYPGFFAEWLAYGIEEINATSSNTPSQPIYERVSLAHLLLKVQDESPEPVPYLYGATYAIVPGLLIPRILDPDKLTAHEGTTILNVHYGIQEREDTATTTIGWGLLNEAYANFGILGVAGLGLLLGAIYGWVTKKTAGASVLALRSLVAMTFAALAVQAEFSAGVYFSALFQSLVSVLAASVFLMERRSVAKGT
jgi:hypothetical protein